MTAAPAPRAIEIWFDFGSCYSYLSVLRIEQAAAGHALTVAWRPFLLGPIFKTFGWDTSPFVLHKAKGDYMWKDMARQCVKYAVPWRQPTVFPRRALLPSRVALLGAGQPWIGDYCRRVMRMNFAEDRDIDTPEAVAEVLGQLGLDPQPLLRAACEEPAKQRLREQTEAARARGIFGAPTFFVDGEMFWGNDRLDDALAWADAAGAGS